MPDLVLLRHGQSEWNRQNRFTGWVDVDLSDAGVAEARAAGRLLAGRGLALDCAYTSFLRRAVRTLHLVQEELDMLWLPVHTDWRLNERHYGGLQGLDKDETAARHGAEQVRIWRRSFDVPPPPSVEPLPAADSRYAGIDIPAGESLQDTLARVMPCWQQRIAPELAAGRNVIVSAHGNSLRALVKHLDDLDDRQIVEVEIPTGSPIHYQLDSGLKVTGRDFLGRQ